MRIYTNTKFADARRKRRQGEPGFTMVEIAIAIGVIGFALVAIIGILPVGMNVQKGSREDTVIGQDARYFMDAIRNGVSLTNRSGYYSYHGLDFLANYVQSIVIHDYTNGDDTIFDTYDFTPTSYPGQGFIGPGQAIIGLLSTPNQPSWYSNGFTYNRAIVRALNGSAVEQGNESTLTSFTYQMDVEILPYTGVAPNTIDYTDYLSNTNAPDYIVRYNRSQEAGHLPLNLYNVQLRFSWPYLRAGQTNFANHQTYETLIASQMTNIFTNYWYFQPQTYTTNGGGISF